MRTHRFLLAALLAASPLATTPADAQQTSGVLVVSRGMLGIITRPVSEEGVDRGQRVIVEVVPGTGADRAGLVPGDTILSVNRRAATQQVMSAGLEPGDTVVLRIRRAGRERDVTVIASERARTQVFTASMLPDTVRGRISIIMDAVRAGADTIWPTRLYIRGTDGDSTVVYHFGGDSIHGMRYQRITPLQRDSLMRFFAPGAGSGMFSDSLFRGQWSEFMRDSVFGLDGRATFHVGEGKFAFGFGPDSMRVIRPTEYMAGSFVAGMRAVAGAELAELNPGLAEYFGTTSGVLVLNAREGTPAERAGLMSGDVIVRANDTDVSSIAELRRAIDRAPHGQAIKLDVLRRGQRIVVRMGD